MKKFIVVNLKASVSSVNGTTMLNPTSWPSLVAPSHPCLLELTYSNTKIILIIISYFW